ncbi:hypothetical protein NEOLEDRAFT_1139682 [Neolentinus lepideus HHB14362 ss-1]|uniref:Uncharacterized protein n=1 Tax=Neolentinus lepideus HHB14362 ss-1 TaxID=1314782 RepID=A0A165PQ25_9AGAM|nr:hypothetical protein NEOLEDRAFT_1139682 [Neolentinus lepideus HHB14362 ss-1]
MLAHWYEIMEFGKNMNDTSAQLLHRNNELSHYRGPVIIRVMCVILGGLRLLL